DVLKITRLIVPCFSRTLESIVPSDLDCTTERWLLRSAKICCGFGLGPILSMTSLWANSRCMMFSSLLEVVETSRYRAGSRTWTKQLTQSKPLKNLPVEFGLTSTWTGAQVAGVSSWFGHPQLACRATLVVHQLTTC